MKDWNIEFASSRQRNQVIYKEVKYDWLKAYKTSQTIEHPWYRCQALSAIAENASGATKKQARLTRQKILLEAIKAAFKCHDENRRVSVAMWPLSVAIKYNFRQIAQDLIVKCISEIKQDSHPISRWDASTNILYCILDADYLMDIFETVFIEYTQQGHGWRMERTLKFLLQDEKIQNRSNLHDYLVRRKQAIDDWKATNTLMKNTKN